MKTHNMIKTNAMRKYRKILSITLASLLLAATFPVNGGTSLAKSVPATLGAAEQFNLGSPLPLPFPFNGALSALAFPTMAAAAGSDFQIVISATNGGDSFGDEPGSVPGEYRGLQFIYNFDLPGVDPSKNGMVVLQSFSVDIACNRFEINGVQTPVLRDHSSNPNIWETEVFRIQANVLKEVGNTLRIATRNENCTTGGNSDDFAVSNAFIHYKAR